MNYEKIYTNFVKTSIKIKDYTYKIFIEGMKSGFDWK